MKVICKNAKVTQRYVSPRGLITYPMIECKSDCPNCGARFTEVQDDKE